MACSSPEVPQGSHRAAAASWAGSGGRRGDPFGFYAGHWGLSAGMDIGWGVAIRKRVPALFGEQSFYSFRRESRPSMAFGFCSR